MQTNKQKLDFFMRRRTKSYFHLLWFMRIPEGRNAQRITSRPWSHTIFFQNFYFPKGVKDFLWQQSIRGCESLEAQMYLHSLLQPWTFSFMLRTKTLFWSSKPRYSSPSASERSSPASNIRMRWRYYLARNSSCAFVCQTNVKCVFVASLCTRGEPTCPGRVRLRMDWRHCWWSEAGFSQVSSRC